MTEFGPDYFLSGDPAVPDPPDYGEVEVCSSGYTPAEQVLRETLNPDMLLAEGLGRIILKNPLSGENRLVP